MAWGLLVLLVVLLTVPPSFSSSDSTTPSPLTHGEQSYTCQYYLSAARGSDGNATSGSSYQEPFRTLQHALERIILLSLQSKTASKANEVVVCVEAGRYNLTNPTLESNVEGRMAEKQGNENADSKDHNELRHG